jgi:hypothetical protein
MLVVSFVSLVAAGCHSPEDISGNLFARGGDLGDWALDPIVCLSGEPAGWKGVELIGEGTSVRLVIHPREEALVTVRSPRTQQWHVFPPATCTWFGATYERTNAYIEDVRLVNGEIDVDCESDVGRLFGRVSFQGCH